MNLEKMLQGPNALVLLIAVMVAISLAFPSNLFPEVTSQVHSEPLGHSEPHDQPQAACNPVDSTVKQFSLTASETVWEFTAVGAIDAWTFDGTVPGPLLCVNVGDTIEVTVINELSVLVSFHVHLPALNNSENGPNSSENNHQVEPGKVGTFSFLADDAGTYLYHDIANGNEGLGKGLYGALIVRDGQPEEDHEIVVILGEFQPDYHPGTYAAIINGNAFPWLPNWYFETGESVRVHLLNAGPSEEHTFHIHGHRWLDSDEGRPIDNKFLSPHSAVFHPNIVRPEGFVGLAKALVGDVAEFEFKADSSGEWMYHCHIYDHINAGMMGHLQVGDSGEHEEV